MDDGVIRWDWICFILGFILGSFGLLSVNTTRTKSVIDCRLRGLLWHFSKVNQGTKSAISQ